MQNISVNGKRYTVHNDVARMLSVLFEFTRSVANNGADSIWQEEWIAMRARAEVALAKAQGQDEPEQYLGLAQQLRPQWYAQMDFCCEPQIASDRKAVFSRIDATVDHLVEMEKLACERDMQMPMPVLQGWEAQDYCSGPIFDRPASLWPRVVGIGSVCRRHVHGPHGLIAIVRALHERVPEHVRFHLFGAKGTALDALVAEFPERIESIDSMAWNYAARWECFHSGGTRDTHADAKVLERWYRAQCARLDAPCQLTIKLNER